MRPLTLLILLLFSTSALADITFAPGFRSTATVSVIADAAGVLQIDRTRNIALGGSSTPSPDPDPVPDPDPTTLSARAKTYKAAAEKINDPTTARQLATLYLGVETYRKANPTTTAQQMETAITGGTSIFLRAPGAAAKWKPVTDKLQADWVMAAQDGAAVADYGTLCVDAGTGLNAAAPNQSAMFMDADHPELGEKAITPDKIMQIIQIIIASGGKLTLPTIFQIIMILLSP